MIRKTRFLPPSASDPSGLDLERVATFEVSSENQDHPLENILQAGSSRWAASDPGPQTIRMRFDAPQDISRISLRFDETDDDRTQEFVISRQSVGSQVWVEIRRQQFNFSPPGTSTQVEDYRVTLPGTTSLEIVINPDLAGLGVASLTHLAIF